MNVIVCLANPSPHCRHSLGLLAFVPAVTPLRQAPPSPIQGADYNKCLLADNVPNNSCLCSATADEFATGYRRLDRAVSPHFRVCSLKRCGDRGHPSSINAPSCLIKMSESSQSGISKFSLAASYLFDWVVLAIAAVVGFTWGRLTPNKRPFSVTDPDISYYSLHLFSSFLTMLQIPFYCSRNYSHMAIGHLQYYSAGSHHPPRCPHLCSRLYHPKRDPQVPDMETQVMGDPRGLVRSRNGHHFRLAHHKWHEKPLWQTQTGFALSLPSGS